MSRSYTLDADFVAYIKEHWEDVSEVTAFHHDSFIRWKRAGAPNTVFGTFTITVPYPLQQRVLSLIETMLLASNKTQVLSMPVMMFSGEHENQLRSVYAAYYPDIDMVVWG